MCRRQQRGDYGLTSEAKSSWERLRKHQLAASERKWLMEKLLSSITGRIHQVLFLPPFLSTPFLTPLLSLLPLPLPLPLHHSVIFINYLTLSLPRTVVIEA